ncbi:hypothetical protein PRZ48_000855 [Zasmidium cellare]|uniref:Uncharacterized protein n=1 Tax=Zasmidium cellare TaxID=395010 RepID=A0ABR0EZN8_ZASCE|nr:hypothetical protein PRZ48_000855 [Zasmidium cellare]
MVVLSSLVVVIQVFVVIPLDVMSSVETPVGTVVIVDVIAGVSEAVLVEVDVAEVDTIAPGRDVVLPSIFRMPEEAKDIETEPLVKADPPGVRVKDPMMIPEPLPDAMMLGASVMPVLVVEVVEVVSPVVEVVTLVPRRTLLDDDVVPLLIKFALDIDEDCDEPLVEDEEELLVVSWLEMELEEEERLVELQVVSVELDRLKLVVEDTAVPAVPGIFEEVAFA